MLRTPSAHCRIPKHKQPIGSISVRLATYGKCCAHPAHTAEYRSTNNPWIPFRSDSRHTENAAHTKRTLCCAHLAHTADYRSTNNPLVPFRSDSRHTDNAAHTKRTLQNTAQTTHWFHFCQTRDIRKMLRTPSAHRRIPKHK
jgi:hypothetical protein